MRSKFKIKYKKTGTIMVIWEEDEWGRPWRTWTISRIPSIENKTKAEVQRIKINLFEFMNWIGEDVYCIRDTSAKQREWTYEQVKAFLHDLEYDRWMYR